MGRTCKTRWLLGVVGITAKRPGNVGVCLLVTCRHTKAISRSARQQYQCSYLKWWLSSIGVSRGILNNDGSRQAKKYHADKEREVTWELRIPLRKWCDYCVGAILSEAAIGALWIWVQENKCLTKRNNAMQCYMR